VNSGPFDAKSHSNGEFRIVSGVHYDNSGVGVNSYYAGFLSGPLLDFAFGLLSQSKRGFETPDFTLDCKACSGIGSNCGAKVVFKNWEKVTGGSIKLIELFAGDLIIGNGVAEFVVTTREKIFSEEGEVLLNFLEGLRLTLFPFERSAKTLAKILQLKLQLTIFALEFLKGRFLLGPSNTRAEKQCSDEK